jgi:hypothetical protein
MSVVAMLYYFNPMGSKSLAQRLHGALRQFALTCERSIGTKSRSYRQQEAQCRATLTTRQFTTFATRYGNNVKRTIGIRD